MIPGRRRARSTSHCIDPDGAAPPPPPPAAPLVAVKTAIREARARFCRVRGAGDASGPRWS